MDDLYRSFETYIKAHQMIQKTDDVVIGVSGGADSVCLLFLLQQFCQKEGGCLTAVHLNHMIRGAEADADEAFVKELCDSLSIPCIAKRIDVPRIAEESGESLEEAGRRLRYEMFCEIAREKSRKIAVAHHRDDNAETVLLNLSRGTGLKGLSGMQPVGRMQDCVIIRPLLEQSREAIEAYLSEQGIVYCTDQTNADDGYARNYIRHHVLPDLTKINARATEHIADTARYLCEIEDYLQRESAKAEETIVCRKDDQWLISIDALKQADPVIAKRVVHTVIAKAAGSAKDITSAHILHVLHLSEMQSGRQLHLPYHVTAVRIYDQIHVRKQDASTLCAEQKIRFTKEELLSGQKASLADGREVRFQVVPVNDDNRAFYQQKNLYTKAFDYDKINGTINVGEKVPGDFIVLQNGTKKIKKFFTDEKIPADERGQITLLKDEESVMWVIGFRISEQHKITDATTKALIVSVTEGENHEHEH